MKNFEEEIWLAIILLIAKYVVLIGMMVWTFRSFSKKKYSTGVILLSIVVSFFSIIFYQTSTKKIVTEFGNVAYVKMPVQYKVLEKETSYWLLFNIDVSLSIELNRSDIDEMINIIKDKKPERWGYYADLGICSLNYHDSRMNFQVNVDSVKETVSIAKKWSFF